MLQNLPHPTATGVITLVTTASLTVLRPPGPIADTLFAALVALVALSWLLALRASRSRIEVRRRLPRSAVKGEALRIVHEVTNRSTRVVQGLTLEELPVEDLLPAATYFPQLLPSERSEARTRLLAGRRGRLVLEGLTLTLSDPFGLFFVSRRRELPGEVLVQPRPRRSANLAAFAREVRTGAETSSGTWSRVREWRWGDPLRRVHWRLTARRGAPMVRLAERARAGRTHVVLDRRSPLGRRGAAAFELAVSLAAGLCLALVEQGAEVSFSAPGADGPLLVRLRGRAGAARLLEVLALVTADPQGLTGCAPEALQDAVVISSRPADQVEGPWAFLLQSPRLPSLPPRLVRREGRPV